MGDPTLHTMPTWLAARLDRLERRMRRVGAWVDRLCQN